MWTKFYKVAKHMTAFLMKRAIAIMSNTTYSITVIKMQVQAYSIHSVPYPSYYYNIISVSCPEPNIMRVFLGVNSCLTILGVAIKNLPHSIP